jgi:polysaccharide pyruvyl transferase WcaK-like protein
MPEKSKATMKKMQICVLGASFDTGNMGVSALAESSIKVILNRWPDAEITLLRPGLKDGERHMKLSGRNVHVKVLHMRFGRNVFLRSHFVVLLLNAILLKILPFIRIRNWLTAFNPYVKAIIEADKVFDITGGDSFSDIYGLRRFLQRAFLQKWLIILFGKELILLPQTYGPFKMSITQMMAKYILSRAGVIYARDHGSVKYILDLLRKQSNGAIIRFIPDVAFVLDSHKPEQIDIGVLKDKRKKYSIVVGLNISGLLVNGGYSQKNMFSLTTNYRELMISVVDLLMKDERLLVLLVPHVFAPNGSVESDPDACLEAYEELSKKHPLRIFLTRGQYTHNDIKYIIGLCDFFIGSRMHSCIAAVSQSIPSVGIAYSRKFNGVFDSIGLGDCVADATMLSKDEILSKIADVFERRDQIGTYLETVMPEIKANVLNMLNAKEIP